MTQTNDVLTAISTLNLALKKMSPHTRDTVNKSGILQVKSLVNLSTNNLCKYSVPDLLKSKLLSLSTLLDTMATSVGFVEVDANGKRLVVETLNECIEMASLFACTFYKEVEFEFYPGLESILTSIVKVGVANNINFS